MLDKLPDHVVASTGFAVLRAKSTMVPEYLFQLLFSDLIQDQLKAKMGKGQYPSVNKTGIENLLLPIPPPKVQEEIVQKCREIDASVPKLIASGTNLTSLSSVVRAKKDTIFAEHLAP